MSSWPSVGFYREHILGTLLPFWLRHTDSARGGVFTCIDNTGSRLLSDDKYVWSQGRFLWLWARLAEYCRRGLLPLDAAPFENQAERTFVFLREHALTEDGCRFLLAGDGSPKEGGSSIYADCFVCLGMNEYARVLADAEAARLAEALYGSIVRRIAAGAFDTDPYPVPQGARIMGIPMFALHCGQELLAEHPAPSGFAQDLLENFLVGSGGNREVLFEDAAFGDTLLARHMTPGHTFECAWFLIHWMRRTGDFSRLDVVERAARGAMERGWDPEYGGILRYVDREGGPVHGRSIGSPYEALIRRTWDTKLWWVHSEALYCCRLLARYGDGDYWRVRYGMLHDYTFRTFPNPDRDVGEWIQIRCRDGSPLSEVVALPVKDPYHILRCMMWLMEEAEENEAAPGRGES